MKQTYFALQYVLSILNLIVFVLMYSTLLYRLGRKLYTIARSEIGMNSIHTNGEAVLQQKLLTLFSDQTIHFLDIGANVGEWTNSAFKQAETLALTVHAFEPVKETNDKLVISLKTYIDTQSVFINQLAVSNVSGRQTIYVSGILAGSNSLHGTPETTCSEQVEVTTIDQYCIDKQINYAHLIKIDIEGHDMFAIEGTINSLQANRVAVLQFEYNHRWVFSRRYLKDVFDFRDKYIPSYHIGKLTGKGILIYKTWHFELEKFFEGNYVIVSDSVIDLLDYEFYYFDEHNTLARAR